jgi:hypothetical protein
MERVDVRRLPADWSAEEEALLKAIDDATATPVEIDRRLAEEWFAGIGWMLDELEDLALRRPAVALELAEHLLVRLEAALPCVDDSDGGVTDALERLLPLHRQLAGERTQRRLRALGDLELLA